MLVSEAILNSFGFDVGVSISAPSLLTPSTSSSVGESSSASVGESFGVGVGVGFGVGVLVGTGVFVGPGVGVGVGPVSVIVDSVDQSGEPQLGVYLPTLNRYSPGPL